MQKMIAQLPQKAKDKHKENKKYFAKLKKKTPKNLDQQMQALHQDEFSRTDCLHCANCCKTTGPLFTPRDVDRIASHLKIKPAVFEREYLRRDEEGDLVLQQLPCAFLGPENHCSIYQIRPKACKEFPHTDRKDFHKISHLTLQNVQICPAAFRIVEEMKKRMP